MLFWLKVYFLYLVKMAVLHLFLDKNVFTSIVLHWSCKVYTLAFIPFFLTIPYHTQYRRLDLELPHQRSPSNYIAFQEKMSKTHLCISNVLNITVNKVLSFLLVKIIMWQQMICHILCTDMIQILWIMFFR